MNQEDINIKPKRRGLIRTKKVLFILICLIILILIFAFITFVGTPIWASGKVQYLTLEGGMFEFEDNDGNIYDLYGVEDVLSQDEYQLLIEHPDTQYNAKLSGWVKHFTATYHMHGTPVDVTSLDLDI